MAERLSKEALKEQARKKAYDYEKRYHGCTQAVLLTFQELLGMKDDLAFKAASPLCAGLGMGKTCGALSEGVMVLGLKYGRSRIEDGIEGLFAGMLPAQVLVQNFEQEFGTTACFDIVKIDWTDAEAAMKAVVDPEFIEKCAQIVGKTAEMVAEIIGPDG